MSKKEKAHPTGATVERAQQEERQNAAAIPCTHFTTGNAARQPGFIESQLLFGAENGQTLTELVRITNLSSREIRRQIGRERRTGALIISDNRNGYFLTEDPAEAQRFARSMLSRSREIARTARAVERAAGIPPHEQTQIEGQGVLF